MFKYISMLCLILWSGFALAELEPLSDEELRAQSGQITFMGSLLEDEGMINYEGETIPRILSLDMIFNELSVACSNTPCITTRHYELIKLENMTLGQNTPPIGNIYLTDVEIKTAIKVTLR